MTGGGGGGDDDDVERALAATPCIAGPAAQRTKRTPDDKWPRESDAITSVRGMPTTMNRRVTRTCVMI